MSQQQFGFLKHRKIIEAIGMAQEVFHSIKKKNQKVMVLQIDLNKAYDRVH